jgi:hypothetical protein
MRHFLVVAILVALGPMAGAEVIRCANPAGQVSYTDGNCPAGAKQVARVDIQAAPTPTPEELEQRRQEEQQAIAARSRRQDFTEAALPPLPIPGGPSIIDPRPPIGDDAIAGDNAYTYPGSFPQPLPLRNMGPRMRKCDARGCQDTLGNHYNTAGGLDSYRGPKGQTCRPVGTTVICR